MEKLIWLAVMVCLCFSLGCATVWDKPGATDADFKRDYYDCSRDASQVSDHGYFTGMVRSKILLIAWKPRDGENNKSKEKNLCLP